MTEDDRLILDFAARWWKTAGAQHDAITAELGLSPTRYNVVDMLRQARTITTRAQLDVLPVGTVVRDHEADIMVYGPTGEGESAWWYDGDPYRADEVDLPALVLWRPEDGDQ